ncbi:hypothetical protein OU995_03030 [Roseateles sp. SL47]|uniref:hypothetical protein n=1 Tax=Roseateles sp. SL47 TaxID=2995138 RepID=UPI002271F456|nr:hypothetical protein [Roseateles sp. SL47]WAC73732.1 hypothetical protein OU995_03030 [Roseateles sp. SL47]
MVFKIKPMSGRDWARCDRDARQDDRCAPWVAQALSHCAEAAREGRPLPRFWAQDRRAGHYLMRLPALMGQELADRYCMRVKPRLYGLRSQAIGDRRVFLVGADVSGAELLQVQQVLGAAFAVHGATGIPWPGDALRDALLVPAPDAALL